MTKRREYGGDTYRDNTFVPQHEKDVWCGTGRVQVGTKDGRIYVEVDGTEIDETPYEHPTYDNVTSGTMYGYTFEFIRNSDDQETISVELIEPDGTKWYGTSGYHYGENYLRTLPNKEESE